MLDRVWRYAGPISVILAPFLFFIAQQGIPSGTWWDQANDPAVIATVAISVAALAQGIRALIRLQGEARQTIESDMEQLARRAFVPINRIMPRVPINKLGVHVWIAEEPHLRRLVKYTMEQQRRPWTRPHSTPWTQTNDMDSTGPRLLARDLTRASSRTRSRNGEVGPSPEH